MIAWQTIEDAVHAWVVASSGLAASHVVWGGRGPVPQGTYISMRISDEREIGHDWIDRETATAPAPGEELEYHARGPRDATLSLQCIAGAETGSAACIAILDDVLAKRILPTRAALLSAAGIGFGKIGPVRFVPGARSTVFEPRAVIDVTLHLTSDVSEAGPYIEHVEVERHVDDLPVTTIWLPSPPVDES